MTPLLKVNAEELVARIAVAAGEIRNSPGSIPECSDVQREIIKMEAYRVSKPQVKSFDGHGLLTLSSLQEVDKMSSKLAW
ncbi:hypothetical protein TNCV_3254291 [Trichonephila clavipes]|nr:hypothetical protein TNCV_3254291 [Trichonephila clavipes]